MKRKVSIFLIGFIICALAILPACGERGSRGYGDSLISPEWSSERLGRSNPNDYPKDYFAKNPGKPWGSGTSYIIPLSLEEMVEMSSLVIRGRVLGFDYLTIQEAGSEATMPYTDYYVEVLDILRGEPYDSERIIVRAEGGENDELIAINEDLCLSVGEEYVFFLYTPAVSGARYNTEGDYYSIIYKNVGLFNVGEKRSGSADSESAPRKIAPYYKTELNRDELDYSAFSEKMEEYNEQIPVDEDYFLKRAQDGLKKNLDSGYISQEEYDSAMAGLEQHGEILYYTR